MRSPLWIKKGGVCVCYKEHISFIGVDDLYTLNNCLVVEICLETEKCFFIYLYRSPSQSQHKFENFLYKIRFSYR